MVIRRITPEERLSTAVPLQRYAFEGSPRSGVIDRERLAYRDGDHTLVVDEDGTAVATATAVPMRQNVRGVVLPMAGVASVATHPLARRRGHVRALMARLLTERRDAGDVVSTLYPFRPSFYAAFGYAGLPMVGTATFDPAGLAAISRAAPPGGDVEMMPIAAGYDRYIALLDGMVADRHGFARFPDYRQVVARDHSERWLAVARLDGQDVGAAKFRITDYGGKLIADELLFTTARARALLLGFLARHVDQVAEVVVTVAPGERPELWHHELQVTTSVEVTSPSHNAPMARVLTVHGLSGIAAGTGEVTVEVVADELTGGGYRLAGRDGRLAVETAPTGRADAVELTAAGLAALVYGCLTPEEIVVNGMGRIDHRAATELNNMFPPASPYLHASF